MNDLHSQWRKDYEAPFKGWDFSYLDGRWLEGQPSWDYITLARQLVQKSKSVLDMGTGGGERFASLAPFPKHATAVEGWKPNVAVARRRLEPLGVRVLEVTESGNLPFADGEFDTVLNRHSAFQAQEVFRILKAGGVFLTQQVGGDDLNDLIREFGAAPQYGDWTLGTSIKQIRDAGFRIKEAEEWTGQVEFKDVGAIVYFLKAIPWVVKDFSVDNNLRHLERLQRKIDEGEKLAFTRVRFLVLADKSGEE
ncbi:MAG: class I SAM-dependent methyltransferase [Dehalococcoidales bacterium]|nr:MAG: class I SAM-dependent methyltransferase [Dehalococcoidales bacterium]